MDKEELKELENLLNYIEDKVEACNKKEVNETIKEYLKELKK